MIKAVFVRDLLQEMVRAATFQSRLAVPTGFDISGHAATAPKGQDIVCAGVSSLVCSTVGLLCTYGTVTDDGERLSFRKHDPLSRNDWMFVAGMLAVLEYGLKNLAKQYPEAVSVEYQEGE